MSKCLFDGVFGSAHCHAQHHHHHAEAGAQHHEGHHHHHNHHHHYHAIHLFNEIVGPKIRQVEQVLGQLHCPELSHTQIQVIRAEVAILVSNKHHKHSVKHALHHFYHELGVHHAALHNPYVVFGPIVAQKIKHVKLELCKLKSTLVHRADSMSQQRLFNEAFHLAFSHLARLINDLHASDLTVKRLEHIKHEVEAVHHKIHQCKDHFYNHIGGLGRHIDASVVGMAEGLKMQWHRVKEALHQRELEIVRA
jgi:hypothetical protein